MSVDADGDGSLFRELDGAVLIGLACVGFCSTDGIDSSLIVEVDGMVLMSVACVDGNGFLRL